MDHRWIRPGSLFGVVLGSMALLCSIYFITPEFIANHLSLEKISSLAVRIEKYITKRTELLLIIVSLTGVFLILLCTSKYGIGLSADSRSYISAARSLLSGSGYSEFHPWWPPLFQTVIAFVSLISGLDPLSAARHINTIVFGLIILISGRWLIKHIIFRPFVLIGLISILLSRPLLRVSTGFSYAFCIGQGYAITK